MWIIWIDGNDWYGGKTYTHQGERFPERVKRRDAKQYKSEKIAKNVAAKLNKSCEGEFRVEPYNETH